MLVNKRTPLLNSRQAPIVQPLNVEKPVYRSQQGTLPVKHPAEPAAASVRSWARASWLPTWGAAGHVARTPGVRTGCCRPWPWAGRGPESGRDSESGPGCPIYGPRRWPVPRRAALGGAPARGNVPRRAGGGQHRDGAHWQARPCLLPPCASGAEAHEQAAATEEATLAP